MEIEAVKKYKFKGAEFNSLKEVQDKVHNIIGEEVLDKLNKNCEIRHKDLFKMLEIICSSEVRKVLLECLDVTIEEQYDDKYIIKNILDYDFRQKR